MFGCFAQVGNALYGGGAGADDPDPLVGQFFHRRTLGAAAGVGVIPATGVEAVAGEDLDAGNAGQRPARVLPRPVALPDHLRITIGLDEHNRAVVEALAAFVKS